MIRALNQNLTISELPYTVSYYSIIYDAKGGDRSAIIVQSDQCSKGGSRGQVCVHNSK